MSSPGRWLLRTVVLGLGLWVAAPGAAEAFLMFPAAEVGEAHALRHRILAEVPPLDPRHLREHPQLPPETLTLLQQRLDTLQSREANNPFFHWAQGEVLRQAHGPAAAAASFERARQLAGPRALIHWLLWQDFLGRDLRELALREERALQAIHLSWGLSRFPLLATELIQQGKEAADSRDLDRALVLYDAAAANAPESPEALMGRASVTWLANRARFMDAGRDLLHGLYYAVFGAQTGLRLASNHLLSLLVAWLVALGLVAAIFALKAQPLFAHDLQEELLRPCPPPAQKSLGLLIFVLPIFLGLGLLWMAVIGLLICAPYLTRREQSAASVILVLLAVLPLGYDWVAANHLLASSHRLALVRAAEQGGHGETLVEGLRQWIREVPNDGLPHYYLGLALKRRGELAQAEAAMARAADLLPRTGFARVGLGNLQYLQGRILEAEATYRRATEMEPALAAAQMNLGQLYAQRLHLDQSDEALAQSLKLDPHIIQTLSPFHGQGLTNFVVDESVPWGAVATGLAPREAEVRAVAEGFWGRPLQGVTLDRMPAVALVLLAVFWSHVVLRGRASPVRRCQQCGAAFCARCQPPSKEKDYCGPCAVAFRQAEGVAAFIKVRRLREGEEWRRQERTRAAILGSLVPGGADLYEGRVIRGLCLCLPTVWLLLEGLVLDAATPSFRFPSPVPGLANWMVLLVLPLYACSLRRSWGKPAPPPD